MWSRRLPLTFKDAWLVGVPAFFPSLIIPLFICFSALSNNWKAVPPCVSFAPVRFVWILLWLTLLCGHEAAFLTRLTFTAQQAGFDVNCCGWVFYSCHMDGGQYGSDSGGNFTLVMIIRDPKSCKLLIYLVLASLEKQFCFQTSSQLDSYFHSVYFHFAMCRIPHLGCLCCSGGKEKNLLVQ